MYPLHPLRSWDQSTRERTFSETEHGLRQKQAAYAFRSLVMRGTGVDSDFDVLAPVIIQAREVSNRGGVRLMGIGGQPVGAGKRLPVACSAPGSECIPSPTFQNAVA